MEWNNDKCLILIKLVRDRKMLWDPTHPDYYNKLKKAHNWKEIADQMNCTADECYKKMESLRGSFRREKSREKKTTATGTGTCNIYKSKWFAFEVLKFLDEEVQLRKSIRNVEPSAENSDTSDALNTCNESAECKNINNHRGAATTRRSTNKIQRKKFKSSRKPQIKFRKHSRLTGVGYLKQVVEDCQTKDDCTAFGEFVVQKLRKLDNYHRSLAQHRIHQVLFDLEFPTPLYNSTSATTLRTFPSRSPSNGSSSMLSPGCPISPSS